jgi:hypothetical protein
MHIPLHYPLALILAAVTAAAVIGYAVWAYVYDRREGHFAALARRTTQPPQYEPNVGSQVWTGTRPDLEEMAAPNEPDRVIELIVVEG